MHNAQFITLATQSTMGYSFVRRQRNRGVSPTGAVDCIVSSRIYLGLYTLLVSAMGSVRRTELRIGIHLP